MKSILSLVAAIVFTGTAAAQLLSEDFSSGVPPVGWIHINNNGSATVGWIDDVMGGRAWHQDESSSLGTADNTLLSPVVDLTGIVGATLTFDGETNWAVYLANHPNSFGDGISNMEITTDGGLTWSVVWTDTSLSNGNTYSPSVDLSAWDGLANVQLGIHYYGTFAQEWWIDNVVIDGDIPLIYSISGLVGGGTANLMVTGATAFGDVLIGYSFAGAGPTTTTYGVVDMSLPITQFPTVMADAAGIAVMTTGVPPHLTGITVFTQAVDLSSGFLTNSLAEAVW